MLQGLIHAEQGGGRTETSCNSVPSQALLDSLNTAYNSDWVVQFLRAVTAGRLLTPEVKEDYLIYMQDFAPGDARWYD